MCDVLDSLANAASAQLSGLERGLEAVAARSAEQTGQEIDRDILAGDVLDGADRVDNAVLVRPGKSVFKFDYRKRGGTEGPTQSSALFLYTVLPSLTSSWWSMLQREPAGSPSRQTAA